MRSTCCLPSFNFFLCAFSEIEVQSFLVFPTWLTHHVTYAIIIIIKTFFMSSRTNIENFVSIRQAVAQKNTKVLCGQTDTQTYKQAVIDWYLRNRQLDLWPCLIKAVSREGSDANQKFIRWFCTKPSKIECLTSLWPWPLTDFDQNLISASHRPPESHGVIWHW